MGLLDVVHTSFGRLMGREHVNCAAGPHQVLVYVKVIKEFLCCVIRFINNPQCGTHTDSLVKRREVVRPPLSTTP